MRRLLIECLGIAACILFGPALAQRAAAADLPPLAAEAAPTPAGGLPSPESADRQMELARQCGFFRDLDESVVTPAIAWGKPLAGGPLRALILNSWFAGREVVELAERLDIKYTHVALLREQDLPALARHGLNLFEPLENRLVESLKGDEPVIAFGSSPCPWLYLRAPTRKALLDAVRSGKGLVYCGEAGPMTQEMGQDFAADPQAARALGEGFPPNLRAAEVRAGQLGKGRVVFLDFPAEAAENSLLSSPTGGGLAALNDPEREAACSLLAKSLIWAGRRASDSAVSLAESNTLKSEQTPQVSITAEISGSAVKWIEWFVQPVGDAPPACESREELPWSRSKAALDLPHLPAGQYVVHAIVRDADRAALAWTSAALTITCDSGLKIGFNQPEYAPGESAAVTVEITKAAPRDLSLQCSLTDAAGRLMAFETRALAAGAGAETLRFNFPMNLAVARTAVARATLFQEDRALARAEAAALVSRSATAGGTQNFLYYIPGEFFREAAGLVGAPAMIGPGEAAARLGLENWRRSAMPGLEIAQTVPLDQLIRTPSLADPEYLARCQEWVRAQARGMAATGDLGLFVADGWNYAGRGAQVTNLSHDPASEKAFRDQARAEFGTLDRLNPEWGTKYDSWDQVAAPRWEQACASGKFCDWIDKRRSEESVVADFFKKCSAAGKEVYPGFRLALSGTLNPSDVSGYDWWKLMGAVDAVSLGDGPQVALARSFARPGQLLMRAADDGPLGAGAGRNAREIWEALFCGLNGIIGPADGANAPLFWPDLTVRPNGAAVARAVRELQAGPADLVAGATREDDGVAILYSQPSLHAAAVEGARGRPVGEETYVKTLAACQALFGDIGLQFRCVAAEEVAADVLRARGCRLLVIPFSQALSPEEIEKINSFVMAGGAVLADLCPGVTDAHGKEYRFGVMEEILGVKSRRHQPLYRSGRLAVQPQPEFLLSAMEFDAVLGEPNLSLSGAAAWAAFDGEGGARAPAAAFHRVGAGMSLLLNYSLADYGAAEESASSGARIGRDEATRKLVRTFLAAARIQPEISVRAELSGDSNFGVRFRSGQAVYLGLSAPPGGSRKVSVSLSGLDPQKRWVYDVRAQKFLGRTGSFDYAMKDSYGDLLAIMPREIGDVRLHAPRQADRGRLAPVSVALDDWRPDLGRTVFRIEVYDPAGNLSAPYTRTIACDGGRADLAVPFALNDAPGEWRVRAVEAVSGHAAEARVMLNGD